MPLEGHRLVIEPKFPRAKELSDLLISKEQRAREAATDKENEGYKVRNRFWSFHRNRWVMIYETPDGKIEWGLTKGTHPIARLIETLDCSFAWGIEQEARAVQTLGTLLRHHSFKAYMLTGMFMEKSKRSGLTYLFRRLRPTVVLDTSRDDIRVRCCLCLHPIGYYEDTWAGAMTPTDDVIAALMLMRGDEPMLWRTSNQHPSWVPEAGIF